jgi:hypothetical protein
MNHIPYFAHDAAALKFRLPVREPGHVEDAGRALAVELAQVETNLVVCWEDPGDAVLAHVVARELGVAISYLSSEEGVFALDSEIDPDSRAVFVTQAVTNNSNLRGIDGLLRHHRIRLVAVAAVEGHPPIISVRLPHAHAVVLVDETDMA